MNRRPPPWFDFHDRVDDRLAVAQESDALGRRAIRLDLSVKPQAEVVVGDKDAIDSVALAFPLHRHR
jgi:hypothetical protein